MFLEVLSVTWRSKILKKGTSARVVATAWTLEMLYNLLMMHREEAGMPTAAPRDIRVAGRWEKVSSGLLETGRKVRTNITPDWRLVKGIIRPDHGINELVEAG